MTTEQYMSSYTCAGQHRENLAVKGLFGSVCGHAVPHLFVNIKSGEKRIYLHYLVNKLIETGFVPAYINYDIACRAAPYFRKWEEELRASILKVNPEHDFTKGYTRVAGMTFGLGRWHAYGHKSACHSIWSMLYQPGFGLSDGEDMERLWAVLNAHAGRTSMMNMGNRNDSLSLVLLHIIDSKKLELPDKLVVVRFFVHKHNLYVVLCTHKHNITHVYTHVYTCVNMCTHVDTCVHMYTHLSYMYTHVYTSEVITTTEVDIRYNGR